jgi:hypothetical protein
MIVKLTTSRHQALQNEKFETKKSFGRQIFKMSFSLVNLPQSKYHIKILPIHPQFENALR